MKKGVSAILMIITLAFFSCENQENKADGKVSIKGKIQNANEGQVVISEFTDSRPVVLDTVELKAGEFSYDIEINTPTFYELRILDKEVVRLALFKEDVEIIMDINSPENISVSGSKDSQEMLKIQKLMQNYQTEVNNLNQAYYKAMSENDNDAIRVIQASAVELEAQQSENVKAVINGMGNSFASLAGLSFLNTKTDFQFIDSLISGLNEEYPDTKMILQIKQQLDDMRALSLGQVAPEIELTNPNGELLKLSDYRGKYVMIDFWAAWCKPCRQENPNVVRLYEKYKDKGFEIYGVSLDRTKNDWVKAIADDGLTWPQVSDLEYFNSAAAIDYKINAIPATYLLDPEGKIIAQDLRGQSLENKLAELFD